MSTSRFRLSGAVLAAGLALTLAAAGCSKKNGGEAGGVKLVKKDQLTVCTHLPYKPFQYDDGKGNIVGFDVDLIGLVAKELKLDQKTVDVDWVQVTSGAAFKAKKCDLGMGGMTITPERQKAILISTPYFDATQALLVQKSSPYKTLADLKGKKVGVQSDTTGEKYGNEQAKKFGYTTVSYDDFSTEVNAVKAGTIQAAINDNGVLYDFAKDSPTTAVAQEFNTGEHYGFAAEKDDANATKLMDKLDAQIAKSRTDGRYAAIYKKWFGTVPGTINKK